VPIIYGCECADWARNPTCGCSFEVRISQGHSSADEEIDEALGDGVGRAWYIANDCTTPRPYGWIRFRKYERFSVFIEEDAGVPIVDLEELCRSTSGPSGT
jgi:hypothetical protein